MRKQEIVTFEKIKVKRKEKIAKRDDWKRERKAKRKAKMHTREMAYAS